MDGIIIVARLESERLPQKHLQMVGKFPLIKWLIERICYHFEKEIQNGKIQVILATPDTLINNRFGSIGLKSTKIFKGDENNIPQRINHTCSQLGIVNAVIADGDNFLLSMEAIEAVLKNLREGNPLSKSEGLPLGMNVMGWQANYLSYILKDRQYQVLETGWGRIFNPQDFKKVIFNYSDLEIFNKLRFTTDYPADLEFITQIFTHFGERIISVSTDEIIQFVINSKLYTINGDLYNTYFNNFYQRMEVEKKTNDESLH